MSDLRARAEAAAIPALTEGEGLLPLDDQRAILSRRIADLGATGPSVDQSGIAADPDSTVFRAWARVMEEVEYVGKGRSPGLNYEFRGIDAVLNVVGPALRKHGVMVLPVNVEPEYSVVTSKGGSALTYCRAVVTYEVIGPKGDRLPVQLKSLGEAFDTGDKASTKAQSVALRTLYINALAIPTREPDRDPEHGTQHELAAPPPPTVQGYRTEILDENTTRNRMHQIRRELLAHPAMKDAMVANPDGEGEMTLLRLCESEGVRRWQQPQGGAS
jgi:hypothetical protein